MNGGDGAPGFTLDALGGIVDKNARGIDHGLRCGFALGRRCFLRAQQGRLHRVDFHHDIGERADQLLFVGELFAEFLDGASGRLQEHFLGVGDHAGFCGEHAFRRLLEGRSRKDFIRQLHGCGDER